ncbi:helix-turn-helix transcriptional regulator [Marivirga tractuosa]|uniref:helix-turn-helix domain-containing protein n=1 Tax=Marivirga tractuosa TaxID=1006 RepID=UPI0035D0F6A4
MVKFNENLKEIRLSKGLTGTKLAEKVNEITGQKIDQRTISDYENGKREPNLTTLINLARTLGVSVDILSGYQSMAAEKVIYTILDDMEFKVKMLRKYLSESE